MTSSPSYLKVASGNVSTSANVQVIDASHRYYLHPSNHPGLIFITITLNEQNYNQWFRSMRIALSSKLELGFVDGTPLSENEIRAHTPVVISCTENRREVCSVQTIANKQIDRTFMFDRVFGPVSQQKDLYEQVVSPIVYEVLEGYNCIIFAYGQTGIGKTYTMEGGARKKNGEFPSDAGVE
ncbi:hypothetical protein AgCh_019541 [Apium graveolens]